MEKMAWGWIITLRGAVDGTAPTAAGPRGRARWRNESGFAMLGGELVNDSIRLGAEAAPGLPRLYNGGKGWVSCTSVRPASNVEASSQNFVCGGQNFALVIDKIRSQDLHVQRKK